MYRKEVNERSPMRVLEKSIHGGLGRGNVGVIIARPGVGKSALLVQIALDDLLRGRKVLHISHEHAVDRVRAFYDEIFHDLVSSYELDQPQVVRVEAERNRLLYSHLGGSSDDVPLSHRGGASSVTKIEETLTFAREVAHFHPDAIIIDGFDFEGATPEAVDRFGVIAKELNCEMWLSAKTEERSHDAPPSVASPGSAPTPLKQYFAQLSVIVYLQPEGSSVRLQLLKDHDNSDLTDLHLSLDPTTMRVTDDDLPPASETRKDPGSYHLFSGGAKGAEATFGECAERWGLQETHYSFAEHPFRERERGIEELDDEQLKRGDFSIVYASHRLGRPLTRIPNIKRILQTVWHQVTAASEVFVIGALEEDGTVRGGTGWGAELARLWHKPLYVFDQEKKTWFFWDSTRWREEEAPVIRRVDFAGIGTLRLTPDGQSAIESLYERSFGPAKS